MHLEQLRERWTPAVTISFAGNLLGGAALGVLDGGSGDNVMIQG